MAMLTVRNLDEPIKTRLRIVAAENAHSMEEEVRQILRRVLIGENQEVGLGSRIHRRFANIDAPDIPMLKRSKPRNTVNFSDIQK